MLNLLSILRVGIEDFFIFLDVNYQSLFRINTNCQFSFLFLFDNQFTESTIVDMIQSILSIDTSIFLSAQSLLTPNYALLVQILGEVIVVAGWLLLIILWLTWAYLHNNEYKKISLRIFTCVIWVFIFYSIINLGLPQWRPGAMEISGATALIPHPTDNSFPSGHALFSAAIIVWIWNYFRRIFLIVLFSILAIITTTARVIGGVHYPWDILGGFLFWSVGTIIISHYIITSSYMEGYIYPFLIRIARYLRL